MVGEIVNLYRTNVIMRKVGDYHKTTHWYPNCSERRQNYWPERVGEVIEVER